MPSKNDETEAPKGIRAIEGLVAGFSRLVERLEALSREGGEERFEGTIGPTKGKRPMRGMIGLSLKVGGLGGEHELEVQPFGNVGRDRVEEVREPMVDLFDEEGELMIVAEMPGVEPEDVKVTVDGTRLTLAAERGERKYRKQLEVPAGTRAEEIVVRGQNGIVELRARTR